MSTLQSGMATSIFIVYLIFKFLYSLAAEVVFLTQPCSEGPTMVFSGFHTTRPCRIGICKVPSWHPWAFGKNSCFILPRTPLFDKFDTYPCISRCYLSLWFPILIFRHKIYNEHTILMIYNIYLMST